MYSANRIILVKVPNLKEETQAFFKELIANNEFPEDQLIKMKEIMVTCEIEPTFTEQNSNSSKPRVSECAQQ
ncbi:MAG: hypothetical protein H0U49_03410 [Parachlamydiaceae bacterium]|nr:hypothetical protein [Parachlamydiaceae bacterium]